MQASKMGGNKPTLLSNKTQHFNEPVRREPEERRDVTPGTAHMMSMANAAGGGQLGQQYQDAAHFISRVNKILATQADKRQPSPLIVAPKNSS